MLGRFERLFGTVIKVVGKLEDGSVTKARDQPAAVAFRRNVRGCAKTKVNKLGELLAAASDPEVFFFAVANGGHKWSESVGVYRRTSYN